MDFIPDETDSIDGSDISAFARLLWVGGYLSFKSILWPIDMNLAVCVITRYTVLPSINAINIVQAPSHVTLAAINAPEQRSPVLPRPTTNPAFLEPNPFPSPSCTQKHEPLPSLNPLGLGKRSSVVCNCHSFGRLSIFFTWPGAVGSIRKSRCSRQLSEKLLIRIEMEFTVAILCDMRLEEKLPKIVMGE